MTKSLKSLLRACMALICALSVSTELDASPILVTVANFPSPPPSQSIAGLVSDGAGNLWGTSWAGGASNYGTVFKKNVSTGVVTKLVEFANTTSGNNRGANPAAALVSDGAGNFWGTTSGGGANAAGTIFKVNVSTGAITTVVDFANTTSGGNRGGSPQAAMVPDGSGHFWGTTTTGGTHGAGTIFQVTISSGSISTKVDFANSTSGGNRGGDPQAVLLKDSSGNFWGTTASGGTHGYGTMFEYNTSAGTITTLVDFANTTTGDNRGANPIAGLVADGLGNLWGSTSGGGVNGGGTFFRYTLSGGTLFTLSDFIGGGPLAEAALDSAGNLWYTIPYGGSYNGGMVFKLNPSTDTGTGFSLNPNTMGSTPMGAMVSDGAGNMWGTTRYAGESGFPTSLQSGTIFKVNTTTLAVTASMMPFTAGNLPLGGVVSDSSGNLWGTTVDGGANDFGTVFKMNPSTGAITTLLSFASATTGANRGAHPRAGLVSDGAGNFWGTTQSGGATNNGTVFKVNVSSGAITTVVDGSATAGGGFTGALVNDGVGNLWGVANGGTYTKGIVFKVNVSTGAMTTVINFASTTTGDNRGGSPSGALISDGAGNLWGTTSYGGANNKGTIFEVNVSTGTIATILDFAGTTTGNNRGGIPACALVGDGVGNLWGTTISGGASGYGTVFEVNLSTGAITTVADFTGGTSGNGRGGYPRAALVSDGAGNFWGTTSGLSTTTGGTIFEVNASTGMLTTVFDLSASGNLFGSILQPIVSFVSPVGLYGTTNFGGTGSTGTVFLIYMGPQVSALTAGNITSSGATISGSANPEGITSAVYVQYGLTTSYGGTVGGVSLGSGTSPVPFNISLAGLSPGTVYHYRLKFSTTYGFVYGSDQTFTVAGLHGDPLYVPLTSLRNPPDSPVGGLVTDSTGNFWGTTQSGGAYGYGSVFTMNPNTGAVTTVVDFQNYSGGDNRGIRPLGSLVRIVSGGVGYMWGTTTMGGGHGYGTVFKINETTGAITTVADFDGQSQPFGDTSDKYRGDTPAVVLANDGAGNLWGTTQAGGAFNCGTLFRIDINSGDITTTVDFGSADTGDATPRNPIAGLVLDDTGYLWGTSSAGGAYGGGTVFKVDTNPASPTYGAIVVTDSFKGSSGTSLDTKRGAHPQGTLMKDSAGNLWGTTYDYGAYGCGTIFSVDASSGLINTHNDFTGSTLLSTPSRGGNPIGALVSDGAGHFLGTTSTGGTGSAGTVFFYDPSAVYIPTIVDFDPSPGSASSNRGYAPFAGLMADGTGHFWGTTLAGGLNNGGTAFMVYPTSLTAWGITTMTDFGGSGPLHPFGGMVSDGVGNLWGTTANGGANGAGTLFKFDPSSGADPTVITSFADSPMGGAVGPKAALVSDGVDFWGTTYSGGVNSCGTVFKIDAATGVTTTVAEFAGYPTNGANPSATLVSDGAGNFWGTTEAGGASDVGTVFKVNAVSGVINTMVSFTGNAAGGGERGANPHGALVRDSLGYFWGTTYAGGTHSDGTVFKVDGSGVIETKVDFDSNTLLTDNYRGANPATGLVSDGAGYLWGTTYLGGANNSGTVFKVDPNTGGITTVVDFNYSSTLPTDNFRGADPQAALASDGIGNLWGTTYWGGVNGFGTVFEINASSGAITTFFDFTERSEPVPGAGASGALLVTPAALYGTTSYGGVGDPSGGDGGGELFYLALGPQFSNPTAGSITSSSATVTGNANPEGAATSVSIEYGTTTSYGSQTGSTAMGSSTTWVPLSIGLAGLTPSTAYHYRLVFVNSDGEFYGADKTFTTAP